MVVNPLLKKILEPEDDDDVIIVEEFDTLNVEWTDADQTNVDLVSKWLDKNGCNFCVLSMPDRMYTFQRSSYGSKVLNCTTSMPEAVEIDEC